MPVDTQTTFQLASCSKAYTSATAAALVDKGVFGWDDPVTEHLPEFRMYDPCLTKLATLRDLLSMRLGHPNQGVVNWGRNLEYGVETIFEGLPHLEVIAGFRELFTYLNSAYTLMSEVIARRTGKTFPEAVAEHATGPLGQTRTFIQEGRYVPTENHAFPHVDLDEGIFPVGMAHCGGRIGESCVYSTADDAALWMLYQLGKGRFGGKQAELR